MNEEALNQVAKFEIFESSSDDELSQGAFESAAHSYQKRQDRIQEREEGGVEEEGINESVVEKERRLKDKLKRQERKRLEKKRKEREQDRQKRKKDLREQVQEIEDQNPHVSNAKIRGAEEEGMDDILNFKDSDRDSLLSYIQSAAVLIPEPLPLPIPMIDTPTRLVNESNEFLEMQLVKKRKASVVSGQPKPGLNAVAAESTASS